jgi:UDP-N-acetylmuramyl pentapeptide phosphotransferase/UDP-N-acetylglucosamine-1-phosphate transferase
MTWPAGRRPWFRRWLPVVPNHRGAPVDAFLGVAMVGSGCLVVGALLLSAAFGDGLDASHRRVMWVVIGIVGVFAAGLLDDLQPHRRRGLVAQLRQAARGRPTAGVVKMLVLVTAGWFVPWMVGVRGARLVLAVPLLAGAANLWNLLDVVPGRALKAFLLTEAVLFAAGPVLWWEVVFVTIAVVALLGDLAEISMLGDSGANVLGFVVGLGLVTRLSTVGMAIAVILIVLLTALAETVTLSRIIRSTPPLRWADDLGRLPRQDGPAGASSGQVSASS